MKDHLVTAMSRLLGRKPKPCRARLRLPEGLATIYAVGDVHGRLDLLRTIEDMIADDLSRREGPAMTIMLGDYADRGPDTAGVIAHLAESGGPTPRLCLCGNHDAMMASFLHHPSPHHPWLRMGGISTMSSYRIDLIHLLKTHKRQTRTVRTILEEVVPPAHLAFLDGLPVAAFNDHFLFVHAGVRPGLPLERQTDHDLLWIREPFLSEGPGLDRIVVHGHTQQTRLVLHNGRLGIDTGAHATGRLSCLRIGADGIYSLAT